MYSKGKVKVLATKTFAQLNISFTSLNPGSHKKIFVQCENCDEIFLRERRKLHQLHRCPTHIIRHDGIKLKWCNRCKMFLTYKGFSRNRAGADGLNSVCKTCSSLFTQNKRKFSLTKLSLEQWMKRFLSCQKSKCKKHGIPCEITLQDLQELWSKQDGKCYYTKVGLVYGKNSIYSANLDRVNPSEGYTETNVVWTSKGVNSMKNHHSKDELLTYLESMIFTNIRLECQLTHSKAKLPFRKRVTDAGHDITSVVRVTIPPGEVVNVETGLKISPPPGWYLTIDGRSSLFKEGIMPFRGTIDATYTGPLLVSLYNSSKKEFTVDIGDRIAQITIHKIHDVDFVEVEEFSPEYSFRGEAGWGSSGRK